MQGSPEVQLELLESFAPRNPPASLPNLCWMFLVMDDGGRLERVDAIVSRNRIRSGSALYFGFDCRLRFGLRRCRGIDSGRLRFRGRGISRFVVVVIVGVGIPRR